MPTRSWQDKVSIPTYPLGALDPNPPFQRQNSSWAVYPYAMQDDVLEGPPEPRDWLALHLENEYLHCIVLPELGGHLYSLYDKVCQREVFYRNHVIKYGLVSVRGAWISGGVEFNFPTGHTPTTVDNVSWEIGQNEDEAWLTVGNVDRVSRMAWSVRLGLEDGRRRLTEEVWLENRTDIKQRHWFWNNSAVPASDDLHLVYPARKARVSGGIVDYPVTADGRDISWYTAHDHADDIFTLDVREDYFGCHYTESDFGMINVDASGGLSGKKYFTWGTAGDGDIWVDLLTDDDGQYVEIQSGRFETQSIWEFLQPRESVCLSDICWMPEHGMDGWVWANAEGALNFEVTHAGIRMGAITTAPYENAVLALEADGEPVWSVEVCVGPEQPVTETIPMPDGCDNDTEYVLTLDYPADEATLMQYEHPPWHQRQPKVAETGENIVPTRVPEEEASAEDLCVRADECLRRLEHRQARAFFEKALAIDEAMSRAHTGLGLLECRAGRYTRAADHLEKAVARDKDNAETWHYLGLARLRSGDGYGGRRALQEAVQRSGGNAPGASNLAWQAEADEFAADAPPSRGLPTFIEEGWYGLGSISRRPQEVGAGDAMSRFASWTRDDPEMWLEEAFDCDTTVATEVLELAVTQCSGAESYPMVHYCLAHWYARRGQAEKTDAHLARARECPLDYCFPSRLEELEVLEGAVQTDPSDWKARYLLGSLYAGLDRREEALAQWRAALTIDESYAVLHRNVAFAADAWEDSPEQAASHYRDAIARNPEDYRYYMELHRIMRDRLKASPEDQYELLMRAPEAIQSKWQVAARIAETLAALRRFDEALAILQRHQFFPWEGATHMRSVWTRCLTGRAKVSAEAGDHAAALADLELALTYPRNLGVGKPARANDARLYWLAAEAAREVGDGAKREEYLTGAADERHRHTSDADWWKLLALRELGREEEAAELEATLRKWAQDNAEHPRHGSHANKLLAKLDGTVDSEGD